jgi:hypothetical protein
MTMEEREVVIEKLLIKPIGHTMRMRADCGACKNKVAESSYESKHEFELKRKKWQANIEVCPHCKAVFIEKKKTLKWGKGNVVDAKNGVFTVYKSGFGWRWSFRYYNEDCPRVYNWGFAYLKEVAKRACEKHKEWKI